MELDLKTMLQPLMSIWPLLVGLALIVILAKIAMSARFKGWLGEWGVRKGLDRLDPTTYRAFHDLYVPRPDGEGTTQIDHVVVSPFGIFVIETKNYGGWIFGTEKQRQWTQQIYRNKFRFQNPLHQNNLHIDALSEFLNLPDEPLHSVIFFIGQAEFKTRMPDNVISKGLIKWIQKHQTRYLDPTTVDEVNATLSDLVAGTNSRSAAKAHLTHLRARRQKATVSTPEDDRISAN